MKIVLDTQGGDKSPKEIIRGGVNFALKSKVEVVFAGNRPLIESELEKYPSLSYLAINAPEVITMADDPLKAVRQKRNSSLVAGIKAVKNGLADAFVSPANTGAVMAASFFILQTISGIERPGIAALLPTVKETKTLVIDVGANTDCSAENLRQFALMGKIYSQEILGISEPKIGLLNIGQELSKGNKLIKAAHFLLKENKFLNFGGNVEPFDIFQGKVDVVVCDGSIGNVMLKSSEAGAALVMKLLKEKIRGLKALLGIWLLKPIFKEIHNVISPEEYGGAPLLGVKGVVIIAHGHSDAEAIANALFVAQNACEHQLIQKLENGLK